MNYLQKQFSAQTAHLDTAKAFVDKFGDKLPEGTASLNCVPISGSPPSCYLSVGYSEGDRQKALALFGDVFGRTGWVQKLSFDKASYDWEMVVDGVLLHISRAEKVPTERENIPVPPTKFPLQLQ